MDETGSFEYLNAVSQKYGHFYFLDDVEQFVQNMTEDQRKELANVYTTVVKKGNSDPISLWIDLCANNRSNIANQEFWFSRRVGMLFRLFDHLADQNIVPFSTRKISLQGKLLKKTTWDTLPDNLNYLIPIVETYGVYSSEEEMRSFLENASDDDMEILAQAGEKIKWNNDIDAINEWLDCYPMTEYQEAWLLYCLLGILDHSELL